MSDAPDPLTRYLEEIREHGLVLEAPPGLADHDDVVSLRLVSGAAARPRRSRREHRRAPTDVVVRSRLRGPDLRMTRSGRNFAPIPGNRPIHVRAARRSSN
jgi:hypothetical protein